MRALAIMCALASIARADATYEDKARGADKTDIAELLWLAATKCDDHQRDDFAQRQCRLVRDARIAALRGKVLAVDGDPDSLTEANGTIALARCIRCTAIDIDGAALFANTNGPAARADKAPLASAKRERASQILPRIEWLVELGNRGWTVVGYRVIARCDGSIIVASPPSQKVAGDPKRCTPTPVAQPAVGSPDDKLDAARALADAARACFAKYRVAGEAKLHFSLAADGSVSSYTRDGFGESPTGACIDAAAKKVKFPRGDRTQVVTYPIVLR